jgi:site-specific recombinase XerD
LAVGSRDYEKHDLAVTGNAGALTLLGNFVPAIIQAAGPRAQRRWVQFFLSELTNDNTRLAYARATGEFFTWLDEACGLGDGAGDLNAIQSEHVVLWREMLTKHPAMVRAQGGTMVEQKRSVPTVKLKLSAIRSLFRYLKEGGIIDEDPAASVRAPKHSVTIGKTAVLAGNEAARILDTLTSTIENNPGDLVALRDRALIALMTFTLARISAAVGMAVGDVKVIGNRRHVELYEKGGKLHMMPCHHELEDYLVAYIDAAGLADAPASPQDNHTRTLGEKALTRVKAWEMVKRRARDAGVSTAACDHTFRASPRSSTTAAPSRRHATWRRTPRSVRRSSRTGEPRR